MEDRKNRVLQAIVEDYVATAEPVGSRTIARKYQLGVSPATIRNEMSDLEELGYLEQPHTSAGRVPSNRGYRYYVDCLMEVGAPTPEDESLISRAYTRKVREVNDLIRETARVLSDTTHLTSMVTTPQAGRTTVRDLHLVPVGRDRALLVYVTDTGFVENKVVDMPPEITMLELQRVSVTLSEHLRGVQIDQINHTTLRELQRELERYRSLLEQVLELMDHAHDRGSTRVVLGGTTHILEQPEFRDIQKVRALLTALEQEDLLTTALAEDGTKPGLQIQIGEEIRIRDMHDCSMVSATYSIGSQVVGRIGVIGPKRMEYPRVARIVDEVSQRLNDALGRSLG